MLLGGAATATAQEPSATPAFDTVPRLVGVLRPGDALKVADYQDERFSGEWLIDSQGNLQMPGLGTFRVAGLSPEQAKQRLEAEMVRSGRENFSIAVWPAIRLAVLGEVRSPGPHTVEPGTNVLQLLTIAGGGTDRADLSRARVLREGRPYPIDLQTALAGDAAGRVVLYSNDVLVVPARRGLTRENLTFVLSVAGLAMSIVNVLIALR